VKELYVRTLTSELRPIAAELAAAPRVYVDANLPWGIVSFMRQSLGWDVLFVLEESDFRRAPDREHFRRALELGRTLITLDHDFFDPYRFPPSESPGVVVCSAPDEAGLRRLLTALDRDVLRASAIELPLRGKTLDWHLGVMTRDDSR
jgi:hypothetical protein